LFFLSKVYTSRELMLLTKGKEFRLIKFKLEFKLGKEFKLEFKAGKEFKLAKSIFY
ncbi:uncharacterized protein TRIREDRAFT_111730, partial [Trichoderma reesei QM6a]